MKRFLLLLLAILLLSSCTADLKTDYVSAKAYYFSAEDTSSIIPTPVTLNMTDEADISLKLFSMLYSTDKKTLRPIIPSAVKLISLDISDKVCSIELSDYYSKLSPINKAAIDACITKSLCSLPFIDSVTIICNGFSFPMREDSFVITTPVASYDILSVNLYYADPTFTDVVCKTEEFPLIPDESLEFAVVSKLFNTPDPTLCQSVFPKGTKLNNVYVSDGCCYVDVSGEFVSNTIHKRLNEEITIFSIVNTLTELPMINNVKFLIDGKDGHGYTYYDISLPLANSEDF